MDQVCRSSTLRLVIYIAVDATKTDTLTRKGQFVLRGKIINDQLGAYPNVPTMELEAKGAKMLPFLYDNTNLKKLSFNMADLGKVSFANLPDQIQHIHFARDGITKVEEDINRLRALRYVAFYGNLLTEIPKIDLPVLERLDLGINQIRFVHYLPVAHEISLLDNKIESLHDTLEFPEKLQRLNLMINELTAIPEVFVGAVNLQELELSENKITAIPEFMPAMSDLRELSLSDNQIKEIPESICQCTKLERLKLVRNQLTDIPDCLFDMPNLREVRLFGNPIPPDRYKALRQHPSGIFR